MILAMTEKARLKIAALITALFLGATVSAATLTHPHPVTVKAVQAAQPTASTQPRPGGTPHPSTEHESYD